MIQRFAENKQFQMLFVSGVVFVALVVLVLQTFRVADIALVNGDVAWYFFIAQKFLDGALFQDIYFDTNPPFPAIIYALPVAVSKLFLAPLLPASISLIFTFVVINAVAITKYLRSMTGGDAYIIVPLCYLFYFIPHSYTDWGHKDYIVSLCLPVVVLAQISFLTKNRGGIALQVLFFVNVFLLLLKPHYLLVVLVMIAARMSMYGIKAAFFQHDTIALALFVPFYFVINYFLFPDYYSLNMPVALNLYTGHVGSALVGVGICLFAIAALCYILRNTSMQDRIPLLIALCLVGVGAVIIGIYYIQGHGFFGHKLPMYAFITLFTVLIVQMLLSCVHIASSLIVLFFSFICIASVLYPSDRLKFYTEVYLRGMNPLVDYIDQADGNRFFVEGGGYRFYVHACNLHKERAGFTFSIALDS